MLQEVEGKLTQIRATGFGDLITVVIFQLNHYCNNLHYLTEKYDGIPEPLILEKELPEHKSLSIVAQTFTAMTVEAFYFDYYFGKTSRTKALEWAKLSPIKKFASISTQFLNHSEYQESELFKKLEELNKQRKRWVHNESTEIGKYIKKLDYLSPDGCIQLLRELFAHFYKYDKSCHTAKFTYDILTDIQVKLKGFSGENITT
jgi:hypothetical protein